MTFGSLFAGIGGFDLALTRSGMRGVWRSEIEPNCIKLLDSKFPDSQNIVDVRNVTRKNADRVDAICGGFPCQDLSVAGKRAGLAGERSGLFFEMVRITDEFQPALLLWENVPGLLSSHRGKDMLTVLMELERIGYSGCWTTLDARWFGLAQRRRRVFGVFARRDIGAKRAAEILSLRERMSRDSAKGRQAGHPNPRVAGTLAANGGGLNRPAGNANELDFCVPTFARSVTTREGQRWKPDQDNFIAVANRNSNTSSNGNGFLYDGSTHTLGGSSDVVAFQQNTRDEVRLMNGDGQIAGALAAQAGMKQQNYIASTLRAGAGAVKHAADATKLVSSRLGVRRLTPLECERLQGFPDGWTDGFADSVRYRMLGNAVAVPCVEWIGRRIVALDIQNEIA